MCRQTVRKQRLTYQGQVPHLNSNITEILSHQVFLEIIMMGQTQLKQAPGNNQ